MTKTKKSARRSDHLSKGWFESLAPGLQDLLCIGVLYIAALIVFRSIVFDGAAFSSETDTANAFSNRHVGTMLEENEGEDALWSPYLFAGSPTFGNVAYIPHNVSYIEAVGVFVVRWLFLMTPLSWFVTHYFLGGVFMFFLVRLWGFPRSAALIAALTFMLSPYAVALGSAGHGSKLKALSYLPAVFLLTHLLFERRDLLSFGLLCAGIGTLLLTNHVQIVYYVFIVIGLYTLYHVAFDFREGKGLMGGKLVLFVGALVVGLGISSYVYLSVYEYSQYSIRGGGEGTTGGLTWDYATNWSMHPAELITLLIPSFFGFQSPYYWGSMPFTSSTIYVGILPVVFAVLALAYKRDRVTIFMAILTLMTLLMSFGKHFAPVYDLLFTYLPFFNKFRAPSTILHLLPFTVGVLGAYGFAWLMDLRNDAKKKEALARVLLIILGVLVALLVLGALFKSSLFKGLSGFMFVKDGEMQLYQQQYGNQAAQIIEQLKRIRFYGNDQVSGLWDDYVRFSFFAVATIGLVVALLKGFLRSGIFAAVAVALLIADLMVMDAKFIHPVPVKNLEDRFRPDATITFLKQQPGLFRVFPLGSEHFMDNTYGYHEIQSLGGYNPAKLKIYQTMIDSCLHHGPDPTFPLNMNVVNMLNTRYVVTSVQLPADRFVLVHSDEAKRKFTYENPSALPRAFFVREVVSTSNQSDVFRTMNSPSFDPATMAIVENTDIQLKGPDSTRVEIVEFESRSLKINAYTSSPALLVISEVYYPAGWRATIDGEETEIYKTNFILRSVVVPSGTHEIVLRFEPAMYAAGWTVSHVSWLITGLCILAGLWKIPSVRQRFRKKV